MLKIKCLLVLSILSAGLANAQSRSIKGKIEDNADKTPLSGATVKLTAAKDSLITFNIITGKSGTFEFADLDTLKYILTISSVGYELYSRNITIIDSSIDLGRIPLGKQAKELGEVTVVAKAPPAQQKGDTVQFNASQFKVNPDANAEDMIKKMPGVTVDKGGTVTAQGEQVRKVTIDGREFFGDDATAALRNLPAEIIDKIQVFDRLSDQAQFTGFDDGNSQKAINIVTKSGMRNGQFGRVFAGYGTDDRYSAGGNMSFFKNNRRISVVGLANNINQQNFATQDLLGVTSSGSGGNRGGGNFGGGGNRGGGNNRGGGGGGNFGGGGNNFSVGQQSGISKTNSFGLNFSDAWGKKVDVSASYFFNNANNTNDQSLRRQTFLSAGKNQFYDQSSISSSENYNHRLNVRLEYRIDSANSLIINPSINLQNNKSYTNTVAKTYYAAGDTANTLDNLNNTKRDGYNIRNNILYRHSFAKRGRTLSVNFNTTFNKNNGESYIMSKYRFFDMGIPTDSAQNQYTDNQTNGYSLSTNIAYTEPVGKQGQLQFSYTPTYSKNKADQETYLYDEIGKQYTRFDTSLSNKFDNNTMTHNGGISYRIGNRDKMFNVGLNIQNTRLESDRIFPNVTSVNQSFTNLLPNLMWRMKVSAKSSFNIFYRASTNVPSVTQLQDVVNNSNQVQLSSGNPNLKQQYSHFVSGRYTFTNASKGNSFFANIFLQTTQDYISNGVYIASADSTIQQGNVLKQGAQLSKPVNLDGYKSLRTFFTYAIPVKFIKSNVSLSTGFSYSKLPGVTNYVKNFTDNYTYNAGLVIASNISEFVDFNLSYSANFNEAKNSQQPQANSNYINQAAGVQFNLLSKNGWFLQNDLSNQSYSGLSDGFNQNFWLWNAGIGKKFLKNKAGELKLSVFDLLKQNQSLVRTVTENYIEDSQSRVLQQYFMLTFTYSLKNFGKPAARQFGGGERRQGPPMF